MHGKIKNIVFIVSLSFNVLFAAFLAVTSASKTDMSLLSFPAVGEGYAAAAAVAVLPARRGLVFTPLEISLRSGEKAFVQYSLFTNRRQSDVLLNALYDPRVVSVGYTGSGISITALREGETLMQYVSNDGIKDLIRVTVTE